VPADREKIAQVVHNLIGNAVKYAPHGTTITVGYESIGMKLKVSVRDQGKGIAADDQQRIFERYYRVKEIGSGGVAGFGIGLYLCKEIVELHHGTIEVSSVENQGSIFSFQIPLA
jgi:signal transduction histidine kinase